MALSTTTADQAWRPDDNVFAPTDVVPAALILRCSVVAGSIEGDAPAVRVAYLDDATATFKPEGAELDESEPGLSEVLVHTAKLSQLVRISREQYSQLGTAAQLSQSVGRSVTRRANEAFVAEPAPTPPAVAPSTGLIHTPGIVDGGTLSVSLDALTNLVALLQDSYATPSHVLLDPLGWAEISKLKTGTGYNSTLLGAGTADTEPRLLGLPVLVDPSLPDYSGLVVDRQAIVSAVGPLRVSSSEHAAFSSDSVLLRATWRFGHVVVRPDRLGKFALIAPGS